MKTTRVFGLFLALAALGFIGVTVAQVGFPPPRPR